MTRRVVYGIGLWLTVAALALTIAAIIEPRWLSYKPDSSLQFSYGLHSRCSRPQNTCTPFPTYADCHPDRIGNGQFCSMWRSTGFLMSLAVCVELATVIAYAVVLLGGKQQRDKGWRVVSSLAGAGAVVQVVGMALVTYLYTHSARFATDWILDVSWILCTVSWILLALSGVGLVAAAVYMPEEGDYELILN